MTLHYMLAVNAEAKAFNRIESSNEYLDIKISTPEKRTKATAAAFCRAAFAYLTDIDSLAPDDRAVALRVTYGAPE
jgi:hypothetical protein